MATVHQFAYGWINPVLAYSMSVLGCLLGILLVRKARKRTGRARVRLLIYGSVAVGGIAIWQSHVISMLGLDVPDSLVRFEPMPLVGSLLVAVLDIGVALFIAGYGPPSWWRIVMAGVVMGIGAVTAQYTALAAVHVGGRVLYDPMSLVVSMAIAMAFAWALLGGSIVLNGLRAAVPAATVLGATVYAMQYSGLSGVRVQLGLSGVDGVSGLTAIAITPPLILFGAAIVAMLAYFTIGTSTVRDLRRIYEPHSEQIEPWMIDIVMSRITADQPVPSTTRTRSTVVPRPPAPRPTPGALPPWRSMPRWGPEWAHTDAADGVAWDRLAWDQPDRMPVNHGTSFTPPELLRTEFMPTEPLGPGPAPGPPSPRPMLTRYPLSVNPGRAAQVPNDNEAADGRWRNRRRPRP